MQKAHRQRRSQATCHQASKARRLCPTARNARHPSRQLRQPAGRQKLAAGLPCPLLAWLWHDGPAEIAKLHGSDQLLKGLWMPIWEDARLPRAGGGSLQPCSCQQGKLKQVRRACSRFASQYDARNPTPRAINGVPKLWPFATEQLLVLSAPDLHAQGLQLRLSKVDHRRGYCMTQPDPERGVL